MCLGLTSFAPRSLQVMGPALVNIDYSSFLRVYFRGGGASLSNRTSHDTLGLKIV